MGKMTVPVENGVEEGVRSLIKQWKADAIRNSDGTELPEEFKDLGLLVYSTLCMVRADQNFVEAHPELLQQKYLSSAFVMAETDTLEIDLLADYFKDQFKVDTDHDSKTWWQVLDRTTGATVAPDRWEYNPGTGCVTIHKTAPHHLYSVNFLVYQIWDSTSMYNALTNDWKGAHPGSVDPYQPAVWNHLLTFLDQWLKDNPKTDVVRFTSVAYHFTNIYGHDATPKYRDWSGYTDCISPLAIEHFEKEKGYRLTPEDFIQSGSMNDVNTVPTSAYLDWVDFINAFVTRLCRAWNDRVHQAGRKSMLFFCDHWIGTEPYGDRFPEAGFDAIVNACKNGLEARRIADVPMDIEKEVRLYPYFFPVNLKNEPSFAPGGDPERECWEYWIAVRRALARNLVDRIGFGGYPSLALQYPDFIAAVATLADEFRAMHTHSAKTPPAKAPVKVGVLNAWGKIRSWITKEWESGGLMESLSGLNVDVEFLSFSDVETHGIPKDIDVIINTGNEGTAWSGGDLWKNPAINTALRAFVDQGGGFLGVGEPTAVQHQGRFFQLADVLGVDRERNLTKGKSKPSIQTTPEHFITADLSAPPALGKCADQVYAYSAQTEVLAQDGDHIRIALNRFGKGRAVYLAGYQFNWDNTRLLQRAICWASGREADFGKWHSTNPCIECAAYPETRNVFVFNNTHQEQDSILHDDAHRTLNVTLLPRESRWVDFNDFN